MDQQQFDIAQWTAAPLQLTSEERFSTSAEAIFQALTDPGIMCRIFPWMDTIDVSKNAADGQTKMGLGSVRRCQFGNGMVLEEIIIGWCPPTGFAFKGVDHNHPFGMRGHVATLHFDEDKDGCQLTWKHYFDHSNPAAMRDQLIESVNAVFNNLKTCFWQRQIH